MLYYIFLVISVIFIFLGIFLNENIILISIGILFFNLSWVLDLVEITKQNKQDKQHFK